ncbi:IS1595 family transposase, partial [Neisseria iguanae]
CWLSVGLLNRINRSGLFAGRQNHIDGIENFRNQAKRILRK